MDHHTSDQVEYTFFPIDSLREAEVHVLSCTKNDLNGVVSQKSQNILPLGDFLIPPRKRKEPDMPSSELRPGARVKFFFRDRHDSRSSSVGTVVRFSPKDSSVLIYTDEERSEFCDMAGAKRYRIPTGHCILVTSKHVTVLIDQHDYNDLKGIPSGVGVTTSRGFTFRGALGERYGVEPGASGRLLYIDQGWAQISWFNWRTRIHRSWIAQDSKVFENCAMVPIIDLEWATLNATGSIKAYWNKGFQENVRAGDYVVYNHSSPCQIEHHDGRRSFTRGAILQVEQSEGMGTLQVKLVGGCKVDEIGAKVRVSTSCVAPLTEKFIPRSATVEIVADLEFKKGNLKGRRALVLLPTDLDGDIGVQFDEDVNGGSLDGVGESRKCLYIPASAVKVSE